MELSIYIGKNINIVVVMPKLVQMLGVKLRRACHLRPAYSLVLEHCNC